MENIYQDAMDVLLEELHQITHLFTPHLPVNLGPNGVLNTKIPSHQEKSICKLIQENISLDAMDVDLEPTQTQLLSITPIHLNHGLFGLFNLLEPKLL